MPLHDVGYRSWEGNKSSTRWRWRVIAATGIQLAFRSTWLSRTLLLSWVPAIVFGIWFFFYEQSIVHPQYRQLIQSIVLSAGEGGRTSELAQAVLADPAAARHEVWASILLVFFRYPQGVLMVILVGLVAPRLIAADLRNRGYLLYFARPIQPAGYIFGKSLVIAAFLAMMTTVPALVLYVVGLCLSPDLSVITTTWDLPLRVLAASLVLIIPVSAVALACSAMTIETRYAAFSWFAIWVVGWVSYSVLRVGEAAGQSPPDFPAEGALASQLMTSQWELLSPFHVLGRTQQYMFGLFPADRSIIPFFATLAAVTLVSLWLVRRQIVSRLRT